MINQTNHINWEQKDDIGILTINNPPQNFLADPEFIDIKRLKGLLSMDVKALIITGAGRHFSAGADLDILKNMARQENKLYAQMLKGNEVVQYISELDIPVVIAIQGVCFGGGLEIALSGHIRICAEGSLFTFPEINQNLIPGLGGVRKLIELTGEKTALEIIFSGDTVNSKKSKDLGIVDYVVLKKDLLNFSIAYAQKLVNDRPIKVINYLMRSVNNARNFKISDAVQRDVEMFCDLASDEAKRNIDT